MRPQHEPEELGRNLVVLGVGIRRVRGNRIGDHLLREAALGIERTTGQLLLRSPDEPADRRSRHRIRPGNAFADMNCRLHKAHDEFLRTVLGGAGKKALVRA